MEDEFIKLDAVTKNYRDPETNIYFQALRSIDLTIEKGTLSAIIGPSGAGKSTLLSIMGGMAKPSTGQLFIDGIGIHNLDDNELSDYRKYVCGFLFQNPENNLLSHLSAYENIIHTMQLSGYPRSDRKTRALSLLKAVGLEDRMKHKMGQLSGGEGQRAGLAVALANNPKILFADEPTGELDSETTIEIIEYLQKLKDELGITIVVVTHDKRFERMTDHSYNIIDGSIASFRVRSSDNDVGWKDVVREEMSMIDQFGKVTIPPEIMSKHKIGKFVRFLEDENGRIYIDPVKDQENNKK
ncbi:MAG: ABC transporter ATP-binding protein [Candidatus Heimdallarchaeota archaeon]|nr:ABC transporter ATP-binding protein [Candidatus Heimdallarchaeota archaeon]